MPANPGGPPLHAAVGVVPAAGRQSPRAATTPHRSERPLSHSGMDRVRLEESVTELQQRVEILNRQLGQEEAARRAEAHAHAAERSELIQRLEDAETAAEGMILVRQEFDDEKGVMNAHFARVGSELREAKAELQRQRRENAVLRSWMERGSAMVRQGQPDDGVTASLLAELRGSTDRQVAALQRQVAELRAQRASDSNFLSRVAPALHYAARRGLVVAAGLQSHDAVPITSLGPAHPFPPRERPSAKVPPMDAQLLRDAAAAAYITLSRLEVIAAESIRGSVAPAAAALPAAAPPAAASADGLPSEALLIDGPPECDALNETVATAAQLSGAADGAPSESAHLDTAQLGETVVSVVHSDAAQPEQRLSQATAAQDSAEGRPDAAAEPSALIPAAPAAPMVTVVEVQSQQPHSMASLQPQQTSHTSLPPHRPSNAIPSVLPPPRDAPRVDDPPELRKAQIVAATLHREKAALKRRTDVLQHECDDLRRNNAALEKELAVVRRELGRVSAYSQENRLQLSSLRPTPLRPDTAAAV